MEEYIKILENMNDGYTFKDCDICNNYNEKTKRCDKHKCMELQAIEHILRDYKRVLKENEELLEVKVSASAHNRILELEKENEELKDFKKQVTDIESTNFIKYKNYISIQKVKDKIEKEIKYHERNILDIENITMLKGKTAKEEAEIEFNKYAIVVLKKMLQELLESEE